MTNKKGKINYGQFVVGKWKGGGIEVLRAPTYYKSMGGGFILL